MDVTRRTIPWLMAGLGALAVAGLFWAAGLSIGMGRASEPALWVSAALLCLVYGPAAGSWQAKLVDSLESIALLSLIGALGALATYAIAALTSGYADHLLAALDRYLGFDWVGLYHLTGADPWISLIGRLGYLSIFFSPTIILLALHWTGRTGDARRFLFAFGVSLAATLLIFLFFPARAALAHHLGGGASYMPVTGIDYVRTIEGLRAGTVTHVDLASLQGMVAFPSFHAASAILFIWAAWPIRWLRMPMLATNLLMLAATPIEGGHYLVDIVGGVLVAALGIGSLRLMAPRAAKEARPGLWVPWRPARSKAAPISG